MDVRSQHRIQLLSVSLFFFVPVCVSFYGDLSFTASHPTSQCFLVFLRTCVCVLLCRSFVHSIASNFLAFPCFSSYLCVCLVMSIFPSAFVRVEFAIQTSVKYHVKHTRHFDVREKRRELERGEGRRETVSYNPES